MLLGSCSEKVECYKRILPGGLKPTLTGKVMKQTLQNLFKPYRPLPTVTAHRNVRMRGQAFISFADHESANRARKDVHEFPLYGKPMVCPSQLDMIPAIKQGNDGAAGL